MADVHSKEIRSYNMSMIKGKNTKPELLVRQFLHANGYRYKLHDKSLPGKPDIVLPKYKTIIFIHGCFWHGHEGCKKSALPTTNIEFWKGKIAKNIERDKLNISNLHNKGWKVIIVWQCELKNAAIIDNRLIKLTSEITNKKN